MTTHSTSSYDAVPYPGLSYPQTHPDRLGTLATLFGMRPAPVDHCRVLELGCASGGNLLPMAESLPRSEFVGIDQSRAQIAEGQTTLSALGLTNVTLGQADIREIPADFGPFDYIIAHGVYSWVPPEVQARLLAICKNALAPNGVAYISYNTYPGWHARGAVREMMLHHTRQVAVPEERAAGARALLAFLAEAVPAQRQAYGQMLKEEHQALREKADPFLLHDQLEELNEPVYFHQFMERAAAHGLQFLAEADISTMMPRRFPPEVTAMVDRFGGDLLGREQYFDFLTNRSFRQTLLCHADIALRREFQPEKLAPFQVATQLRCSSPVPQMHSATLEEFRTSGGGAVGTNHPLTKAALIHLAEVWPQALSLETMLATARGLLKGDTVHLEDGAAFARDNRFVAENLLQGFTSGAVELHLHSLPLSLEPGEYPRAPALARLQAARGQPITNLRHEVIAPDGITRHLLVHLDGTRNRRALLETLVRQIEEKGLVVQQHGRPITNAEQRKEVLAEGLEAKLRGLARSALLVG